MSAPLRLLRTIRLDPSDGFVFEPAAEPGEWAVSGAFRFCDADPASLSGKARAAFRSGFLGVGSFGWSTLAEIVDASDAQHQDLVDALARQLVARLGAPDLEQAGAAAREEIAFVGSLCDHPAGTLIAVHRTIEQGAIREAFRTLKPRPGARARPVFAFEAGDADDAPDDAVDLAALARDRLP